MREFYQVILGNQGTALILPNDRVDEVLKPLIVLVTTSSVLVLKGLCLPGLV